MRCASCKNRICYTQPHDCSGGVAEEVIERYEGQDREFSALATAIESEGYMKLTRLEETIIFARRMGFKRLGVAFCVGFSDEAGLLEDVLKWEFDVYSVCCKIGGISKDRLNMKKLHGNDHESMCNPILQAEMLNRAGTDMNIILGLCVGHDMLFTKHSEAPVTTLVAKDRVLAHNPVGALYSGYHRNMIIRNLENGD